MGGHMVRLRASLKAWQAGLGALLRGSARRERLEALEREVDQCSGVIHSLIERHYVGLPPPPEKLRLNVGMSPSLPNFWALGMNSSRRVLEVFGERPTRPILDWGCGSGRTLLWLLCHEAYRRHYHGCDVDAEAISWLKDKGPLQVQVSSDLPPLPYPDGMFGGLFAFSVLTHIHPRRHREWYAELRRVLEPGGRAYLTTLGASIFEEHPLPAESRDEFRRLGYAYIRNHGHYKDAAIVSEEHTRSLLEGLFRVESYQAKGYRGYRSMDAFLVRREG